MKILMGFLAMVSLSANAESCNSPADKVEVIQPQGSYLVMYFGNPTILINCESYLTYEKIPIIQLHKGECTVQENNEIKTLFKCAL